MKKNLFAAASAVAIMFGTSAIAQETVTITNTGDIAIVGLGISGSSDDSFGENLLDGEIGPGESVDVEFDVGSECEQDIRAVYEDGDFEDVYNIDLCAADDLSVVDDNADEEDPEEDEEEDEEDEDGEEDEEDEEDEEEEDEEEEEEEEDEEEEDEEEEE